MTEVSIMVLPGAADGTEFKPRMLLETGGLWHETSPLTTTLSIADIRAHFAQSLEQAVKFKVADALDHLSLGAISLANNILPREVKDALNAAREAAKKEGVTPRITLHVSRTQEWIPWEAMNLGGYLGLDFEIARLPILEHQPRQSPITARDVATIRSVLGRKVADPPKTEFDVWTETFAEVLSDGSVDLIPADAAAPTWPTLTALATDAEILHVTCHGKRNKLGLLWSLDPTQEDLGFVYVLDAMNARGLEQHLAGARPLVFGNACSPDDAAVGELTPGTPVLATVLFEYGAANVVASFASLSIPLAMRFAKAFYNHLLARDRPVAAALRLAKQDFYRDPAMRDDPTYLLYCLYGPADTHYRAVASGSPRPAARAAAQ